MARARMLTATLTVLLTAALALPVAQAAAKPPAGGGAVVLEVLSNRADLISGGDALVEVRLTDGAEPAGVRLWAGERAVTEAFALRPNGRVQGVLDGLALGENVLTATLPDGRAAALTITNHPNGGPVFSGPQIQPWTCQSTAVNAQCDQPPSYEFVYRSSNPLASGWQAYDPASPPSDVAQTTTDEGVTVPFIVRVETGYQDRDQYKIATLFQPGEDWQPWAAQEQWNHKLLITHGGGCGAGYGAGGAPDVLNYGTGSATPLEGTTGADIVPAALGSGFAVMSTALNNNGHNCNLVTQAESMIMAKERIVEQYGPIRYTVGAGCSGGALAQLQVSNAYPGAVYQGLITTCTYPDTFSAGIQFADLHLLRLYFENPGKWTVPWSPTQMAAVEGHLSHVNAVVADEGLFKSATDPTYVCNAGIPQEQRYHPQSNPGGTRCSILDFMINVLGPRPESVWSPMEQAAGRGFAGLPLANDGVQYGLEALRRGEITTDQFVDVNAAIGGLNVDVQPIAERTEGDVGAVRNLYRSGAIDEANNLSGVAIINHGGPDPGAAHDYLHAFWVRSRLEREQGHFANHVMWFGHGPLIGDLGFAKEALFAMDRWLSAVEADTSDRPLAEKIVADRPADVQDRCSNVDGVEMVEVPGVGRVCEDPTLQTHLGSPRTAAGNSSPYGDIAKCTLKPMLRTEYYPTKFTDAQWDRLVAAFPNGVCDWSAPGVGQADTVPWLTYADANGDVVYGGTPLGAPPVSKSFTSEGKGG